MHTIAEERDWEHRRGRFEECERDEPGKPEVMPGLPPILAKQTHTTVNDEGREYHDGTSADMDT
jgi:hypothetical protein